MFLNLRGKAKEAVRQIDAEELGAADGVEKIITKLDTLFLKDKSTQMLLAFKAFYDYRRSENDSYADFVIKFEKLYHKLTVHKMTLPDQVKAYFVLIAANLSEENEKLARTVCGELTYDNMKDKIKKIFGDLVQSSATETTVKEEEEEVMYTEYRKKNNFRNNFKGQGKKGFSQNNETSGSSKNYTEYVTKRCYKCGSKVQRRGRNKKFMKRKRQKTRKKKYTSFYSQVTLMRSRRLLSLKHLVKVYWIRLVQERYAERVG